MKLKKIVSLILLGAVSISAFSGCGSESDLTKSLKGEKVYLNYATGMDEFGNFNNDLYSYNQMSAIGADPGAIYVPEERDAENGGYYYIYATGGLKEQFGWNGNPGLNGYDGDVDTLAVRCFRSKDLSTWTLCGSERGYSIIGRESDWEEWTMRTPWAPEVVYNEAEQKYYMFYCMASKLREEGELKIAGDWDTATDTSKYPRDHRNYIGIATSDAPNGPFTPLARTETVIIDGQEVEQKVPCINFPEAFDITVEKREDLAPMIDISPFVDEDGTLYLYMKHTIHGGIFGMKMSADDWTKPDYDTFTCLLKRGYANVNSPTGKAALTETTYSGEISEQIIEGPHMIKYNGEYFLTFSMGDYLQQDYAVYQAKGTSPLGKFARVGEGTGALVLSGVQTNNFKGTGHHSFVYDGKEYFIIYHAHQSTETFGWDRYLHADRVSFREVNGETIVVSNGPSKSLQWLPEQAGEYSNIASMAKITVSGGSGVEYLNDGLLPYYTYNENNVFEVNEDVTVTLTFDQPVSVVSLMIYNSFNENSAFSNIKLTAFELAEQPTWASKDFDYAVIENLQFPTIYYDEIEGDGNKYINCAPAVAEFNEIKVTSISFMIAKDARIKEFDKAGNVNTKLNLTEIAVIGRA